MSRNTPNFTHLSLRPLSGMASERDDANVDAAPMVALPVVAPSEPSNRPPDYIVISDDEEETVDPLAQAVLTTLGCMKCTNVVSRPWVLPCGHAFCGLCLHKQFKDHCPVPYYRCSDCHAEATRCPVVSYTMMDVIEMLVERDRLELPSTAFIDYGDRLKCHFTGNCKHRRQ